MLPFKTIDGLVNVAQTNPILHRQDAPNNTLAVQLAHFNYLGFGEFGASVSLSLGALEADAIEMRQFRILLHSTTTLLRAVPRIIREGAEKKVIGVDARGIVAPMKDTQPLGNLTSMALIHHAVGLVETSPSEPPPVSRFVFGPHPVPTTRLLDDVPDGEPLTFPVSATIVQWHKDTKTHLDLGRKAPRKMGIVHGILWHHQTGRCDVTSVYLR